nr:hypothetical protein [uncultured Prevotella sp.]
MAKIPTVVELVGELPKEKMPEERFKTEMRSSIYGDGFLRTVYQLACQLGLYCIDDNEYIPRFNINISESQAHKYMENWIWHYYVPNPYTKSFSKECEPQLVMPAIVNYMEENPGEDDLAKICSNIWGENFGNLPNLRYVIDEYSRVAKVGLDNKIKLVPNYKQIMSEALDRNNKRMFFDSFDEPNLNDKGQAPIEPTSETTELDSRDYAYMAAIKTKPFLILGGFSGTGKSLLVKSLAFATCPCDGVLNISETSPGNYLLVSVKPNWHDATDITGFRSSVNRNYYVTDFMRFLVKAKLHPNVPFFVCLDEMNLAPVEEYFADFLSVIESRKRKKDGTIVTDAIVPASVFNDKDYADDFDVFLKIGLKPINEVKDITEFTAKVKESDSDESEFFEQSWLVEELKRDGLTIPQNVIIIGTVNMDDTTNSFSRKVIDRAMTFETIVGTFDSSYFDSDVTLGYVKNYRKGELFISDEVRATEMMEDGRFTLSDEEKNRIIGFINDINSDMEGTPFKISYRILNETILLYRAKQKIVELMGEEEENDGVEINTDLNSIFDDVLMQKVLPRIEGDFEKCDKCLVKLGDRAERMEWKQSSEKIEFMIKRFGKDHSGFTSFWN